MLIVANLGQCLYTSQSSTVQTKAPAILTQTSPSVLASTLRKGLNSLAILWVTRILVRMPSKMINKSITQSVHFTARPLVRTLNVGFKFGLSLWIVIGKYRSFYVKCQFFSLCFQPIDSNMRSWELLRGLSGRVTNPTLQRAELFLNMSIDVDGIFVFGLRKIHLLRITP